MGRTRPDLVSVSELKQKIHLAKERKKHLESYLQKLHQSYHKGEISYSFYLETIHLHRNGKTIEQWINYYEHRILEYQDLIKKSRKESVKKNLVLLIMSSFFLFLILIASLYIQPELTGFAIQTGEVISDENTIIETTQQTAILGQPVKWTKTISLSNSSTTKVRLPLQATNISVNKITSYSDEINQETLPNEDSSPSQEEFPESETNKSNSETKQGASLNEDSSPSQEESFVSETGAKFTITGSVILGNEELEGGFLVKFFRNIGRLTGGVIGIEQIKVQEIEIDDSSLEYEVEYETPAPTATEEEIERGKRIKISSPKNIHYENVLAFTNLDENLKITDPSSVRIKWIENDTFISPSSVQDTDGNGIYDYIEWIAPSLSTQTFEIIVITKAEHLDSNRNFVSDIYSEVRALDNIWSETISSGDYVRVTFEIPLSSTKDITIYPRVVSGNPKIEIYEQNKNKLIAEFTSLNSNEYNKVFLTNLKRSQDTFDLRISGGSLEFDHIIDPQNITGGLNYNEACVGGNCIREYYSSVINYDNGTEIVPINTTIVNSSDPLYDFEVTKNEFSVFFKETPDTADTIKFIAKDSLSNERFATYQTHSLNYRNALDQLEQIAIPQTVTAQISDNELTYPDVFGSGINLSYTAFTTQLKEKLIIQNKTTLPNPPQFILDQANVTLDLDFVIGLETPNPNQLDIYVDNVLWNKNSDITTQNKVDFRDDNNFTVFFLPKPIATDANGSELNLTYELKKQGNSLFIILKTNYTWLNDTTRVYPVSIDPTTRYPNFNISNQITEAGLYNLTFDINNFVTKKTKVKNANVSEKPTKLFELHDLKNETYGKRYTNLYAAKFFNAEKVTLTTNATGVFLQECSNWNFANNTCDGSWKKIRNIRPGKDYSIELNNGSAYSEIGLIAINTYKSIYLENELADILIGVLDEAGTTICNANVTVLITDPNNIVTNLTTEAGNITRSGECSRKSVTYVPDYSANYNVTIPGTYWMNTTATFVGVEETIISPTMNSTFEVRTSVDFDIERFSATRIFPEANYFMNFTIKANANFIGNVTEIVPESFVITPSSEFVTETISGIQLIKWNVSFIAGNTYNLSYEYDAPDRSPEFYLLGPLEIGSFKEARQWQIASDAGTFPSQTVGTAFATNPSVSHNSPAGTDTILIVTTAGFDVSRPTTVTWAGSQSLTELIGFAGNGQDVSIWYRINPTSGTNSITSTGGGDAWWTVKTFHGIDQTNPFGNPNNTNTATGAGGGNAAVTITTSADDITTEVVAWKEETGTNLPTNTNTVEDSDSGDPEVSVEPRGQDSHTDDTGAITVGWAQSDGTNWAIAVAGLKAAAAGGDTTPPTFITIPANVTADYLVANVNAVFDFTDETAISMIFINDTSNFTMTNSTKTLTNNSALFVGSYALNVTINDSSNNINWTTFTVTVNSIVSSGSLSGTASITFGTAGDVQGTESNTGDADVIYTLYRNGTAVSNPDTSTLGVNFYSYIYNATGGQNYTANASLDTFSLTVNQATPVITKLLNGAASNISVVYPTGVNASGLTTGGTITIYRNGTSITNNVNTTLAVNYHEYRFNVTGNENYTDLTVGEFLYATVTQSADLCGVQFNETSPLQSPGTFLVWSNCTSANFLTRNGTVITNNSEQSLSVGAYNFSTNRTDTVNYSIIFDEQEFIISAANTPPQWADNSTNSTLAGEYILHSVNWTDDSALSGYIFEFDNGTGTLVNDTFVEMIGTFNYSNVSKVVDTAIGEFILWRVYTNDSSNNLNSTDLFNYTTTSPPSIDLDLIYPTGNVNVTQNEFFNVTVNVTCRNADCEEINVSLDPFQFTTKSAGEDKKEYQGKEKEIASTIKDSKEVNATFIVATIQQQAILGQPVKWTKTVSLDTPRDIKIILPDQSNKITVNKITSYSETKQEVLPKEDSSPSQEEPFVSETEAKFSITGGVIGVEGESKILRFFKNILGRITGGVIGTPQDLEIKINDVATNYEIEYETPAPHSIEEEIKNGKRVKIIGPETIHYKNVLAFTTLDETLNIRKPSQVRIHWVEEDSFISIQNIQDTDNNGIYDYIEWIAPSLSEATFDIIVITKAEHLDSNREFISDIYDEVRALDDVWSETIPNQNYVRVTFEIPLDSSRDITIYPRIISGAPRIEIYEVDGTEIIAEFTSLNDNQYNKIFLTNLVGEQDTFDLLILGGSLEFDHIIDPWFNSNWGYRKNITIQASQVASTLTNFPVYVNLSDLGSDFFGNSSTNCADLRVIEADETTETAREVVFCDTGAETGELHFLADSLSSSVDTVFWIYYNNTAASEPARSATFGSENVWNDNYLAVYHLQEAVNNDANGYNDSTSNVNHGQGVSMSATAPSGKLAGLSQDLIATADSIDLGASSRWSSMGDVSAGAFTISAWVNIDVEDADRCIVCQADATNSLLFWADSSGDDGYIFYLDGDYVPQNTNPTGVVPGTWEHVVASYDDSNTGAEAGLYYNGALDGSRVAATFVQGSQNMLIGMTGSNARPWDGQIDEVRISNFTHSANWIAAGYTNQNTPTTFYTIGPAEQDAAPDTTPPTFTTIPANVTADYLVANVNADFDATDETAFGGFYLNDTSNFTIDYVTGILTNSSPLFADSYALNVTINDTALNINWTIFTVTVNPIVSSGSLAGTASITYPTAGDVTGTETNTGDADVTYTLYRNLTSVSNPDTSTLGVNFYSYIYNATSGQNYTINASLDTFSLTVTQSADLCGVQFNETSPLVSPGTFLVWSNCTSTFTLTRNGTTITNNTEQSLAVGAYNFSVQRTDTVNYSNTVDEQEFRISSNNPPQWSDDSTNSTIAGANVLHSVRWTDDSALSGYIFSFDNGTGTLVNDSFVVMTGTNNHSNVTKFINNTVGTTIRWRVYANDSTNQLNSTDIFQYTTTEAVKSGLIPTTIGATPFYTNDSNPRNITLNQDQSQVITFWVNATGSIDSVHEFFAFANKTSDPSINNITDKWNVTIKGAEADIAPVIYDVTDISDVTLTDGPGATYIIVNFSVSDDNGAENLVNSSAMLNFTKSGEELRLNSSCAVKDFGGNFANYTCNVTMWWYDSDGSDWRVYANITDQESNLAINDTDTFTVNTLTGFVISPTELSFATLLAGATNQTPSDFFTLNNTGNVDIASGNVEINSTDLEGETTSGEFLFAANFSASPSTGGFIECNASTTDATALVNRTSTGIVGSILAAGNFTKEDGTAQESIYLCLRETGFELSAQQYSTDSFGSWTIRILLVAITSARRRKKKEKKKLKKSNKVLKLLIKLTDELRMEYSREKEIITKQLIRAVQEEYGIKRREVLSLIRKDIEIPTEIFSKGIGVLESLTKYMKENLNMNYKEIAEILGRDERTIWTAYKKATEKQKEPFRIKGVKINLPISVFENEGLTALESIIKYLKEKGMKYSEIAELLERDQRNIWTIYSRVKKKTKKKVNNRKE